MASKNCSDSEMSSENESESSEASVNSFIFDYDESVEPFATEEEALEYQKQAAREKEEENVAERRKAGHIDIKTWYVLFQSFFLLLRKLKKCVTITQFSLFLSSVMCLEYFDTNVEHNTS